MVLGRDIELKAADGRAFTGYLVEPAQNGPGVVVLQEIFGVNGFIRGVCDR